LIFLKNGTLLGVRFDLDRLEVRSAPVPVLDEVAYSTESGFAQIGISRTGALVYRSSAAGKGLTTVQLLDAAGHAQPLLGIPGDYFGPALSPDGTRLALTSGGDIWIYEFKRDMMTRLTSEGGQTSVLWTPDGQYLVCRGEKGMLWLRADGSGQPQPLTRSENLQNPWSFAPDGSRLAFVENNPKTGADIWTVPVRSDAGGLKAGTAEVFLDAPFNERAPTFSPDGRWLAYFTIESGRSEVYVRRFPGRSGKRQISNDEGTSPVWSPNRHELFFRSKDNQIMVAPYTASGDSFVAEKPRLWSPKKLALTPTTRGFDVASDGQHIVATLPAEPSEQQKTQHHVTFLLNFLDELHRRLPTGGKPLR
jgi:eukaryotic-like serine/threonine-protein kinase